MTKNADTPLEPLRQAHEDEYFIRQNRELAARLKNRLKLQESVHDKSLADSLEKAGFDADLARVLYFIPLVDVAWADRHLDSAEKDEILKLASVREIEKNSRAYKTIETWLMEKPTDQVYLSGKSLLGPILEDLKKSGGASWLTDAATRVAQSTGGLFGLGSKISSEEKEVLKNLTKKLS